MQASHEVLEHGSAIALRLRAPSLERLYAEAAGALARLQLTGRMPPVPSQTRTLEVVARDPAALLADWLNELVYLGEREFWVTLRVDRLTLEAGRLSAQVSGIVLPETPSYVKAATLEGLSVQQLGEGQFEAYVVLDV